MPIVQKLAENFTDLKFEYSWADEGLGVNVGKAEFENGEIVSDEFYEPNSKEAYELAAELWGLDLAEEGFVFDEKTLTYEYRDEPSEVPQIT